MVVIYAEKPDMGEKIAKSLDPAGFCASEKKNGYYKIHFKGKGYAVTWGYGHLCALADADVYNPDYKNWRSRPMPFFPDSYRIVLNTKSKNPVVQTHRVVSKLFKEAEYIVNATDFDREGELIFYYLYTYDNCHKPVMRAKLSGTTAEMIQETFSNLLDSAGFQGLVTSARCRAITDWIVGTNLTVAATLANGGGKPLPIGRVQTPALAMVVERDRSIRGFRPEPFYTLEGTFETSSGEKYKGVHIQKKFQDRKAAEAAVASCGKKGIVESIEKKDFYKKPPSLYSMDTIQMDANSAFGFPLKKTLDIIQSLYEKGFVTYPRTDSQFLPEGMQATVGKVQEMLRQNGFESLFTQDASVSNMSAHKSLFFDDAKVGSHYAIIPTEQPPVGLSGEESKVYGLIADSVIRMLYPDAHFEKTKVITDVGGEKFATNGSTLAEPGWMAVHGTSKEELIPHLREGEGVSADCHICDKQTEPPKHFTDKTILMAMINAGKELEDEELRNLMAELMAEKKLAGIGTVATRADIIDTLIRRGFLVRDKNKILSTEAGQKLIGAIPIAEIKSAELTARCERKLNQIMSGKESPGEYLRWMYGNVSKWCSELGKIQEGQVMQVRDQRLTDLVCPACGAQLRKMDWGYGCSRYKEGCKFGIGRICGKMLTEGQVKALLEKKKVGPISGFKRNDGTPFEATLILEKTEERESGYKISFEKKEYSPNEGLTDIMCPVCGAQLRKMAWGYGCSRYKEGCKFGIGKICGKMLTENQVKTFLNKEKLGPLPGLRRNDGTLFEATIVLEKVVENGEAVNYKVTFEKKKSLKDEEPDIYARCPKCGGSVVKGRYGWVCGNGCGAEVPYELSERKIEPEMAEALFSNGQTPMLEGFFSKKKQKYFPACLVMNEEGKVKFRFPEKNRC